MFRVPLWPCLLCSGALFLGQIGILGPGGVLGQTGSQPYQPAVPAASTFSGGGYPGYYGGGGAHTAAGSSMQGMASVISAQGDYNLSTSAAAINMTQAQRNAIQNRQQATNAYFEMRAVNRAARAAEEGPPPSKEQLARISAARLPKPLSSSEVNPVSGQIAWPELLQDEQFGPERAAIEQLTVKRSQYGKLGISDSSQAGHAIESMSGKLQAQIRQVPPQRYAASKSFLKSMMFDMTGSPLN